MKICFLFKKTHVFSPNNIYSEYRVVTHMPTLAGFFSAGFFVVGCFWCFSKLKQMRFDGLVTCAGPSLVLLAPPATRPCRVVALLAVSLSPPCCRFNRALCSVTHSTFFFCFRPMASIRRRTKSCPVIFFITQHTHAHTHAHSHSYVQIFVILLRTQALINKQLDKRRAPISL